MSYSMNLRARPTMALVLLLGLLGTGLVPVAVAPPASAVLPAGYQIPAGTSVPARVAVTFALAQLGKPYVLGAIGPNAYDCSGLTMTSWAHAGRSITRTTFTQHFAGTATTQAGLRPGDLVLIPGAGSFARPDHVGMFIGQGLVIEAPHTGDVVKILPYTWFVARGVAALRHIA